jgi:hypothetical protein
MEMTEWGIPTIRATTLGILRDSVIIKLARIRNLSRCYLSFSKSKETLQVPPDLLFVATFSRKDRVAIYQWP